MDIIVADSLGNLIGLAAVDQIGNWDHHFCCARYDY